VLQRWLARRGLALTATLSTLLLSRTSASALPIALQAGTIKAVFAFAGGAAKGFSPRAALLADGMTKSVLARKFRIAAVVFLALIAGGIGTGLAVSWSGARDGSEPSANPPAVQGPDPTD
jgi:hypothetical protein